MNEREQTFAACLERLQARHGHLTLDLDFGAVVILVAQVQLALRHPANHGHSAQRACRILEDVIGHLERSEPALGPLLRLGFDPREDVARGY